MKQIFGGKVLLFSVSKRMFSFHIPAMNAQKLFYILYPVGRTQCQCELSFESYVYPVYWNFMTPSFKEISRVEGGSFKYRQNCIQ